MLETLKRAENTSDEPDDESEVEYEELPAHRDDRAVRRRWSRSTRPFPWWLQGNNGTDRGRDRHRQGAAGAHDPRTAAASDQPFLAVDCGAIAPTLIESELFGAVRGAYTGSDRDRVGVFEAANHGTVFLDEIGEVDQSFQLKLLRFLQEREIRPVGAPRSKQIDVRVVAATNRDLHKLVQDGKFREDLWYRLAVIRIKMPPLRERHGDVPLLAQHFVERSNQRFGTSARLTESGLKTLQRVHLAGEHPPVAAPDRAIVYSRARRANRRVRRSRGDRLHATAMMRPMRHWPTPKPTRSGKCWPPPAEISRARPRSWESNVKHFTANSSGWASIMEPHLQVGHP